MGRVLSLQGGMAAGKTTVARYLADRGIPVLLEDISRPVAQCRALGLDKHTRSGYVQTQRLFIRNEILRWNRAQQYPCAVMDLGAEEIEFYTLCYPATIGQDWPVEQDLADALAALRRCRADRTLFLDASPATLLARCQGDTSRDRGFFRHSTRYLLPAKRAWFSGRPDVTFLCTDGLPAEAVCRLAHRWVLENRT